MKKPQKPLRIRAFALAMVAALLLASDSSMVTLNAGSLKLQGHNDTVGGLAGSGGVLDLAGGTLTVAQMANTSLQARSVARAPWSRPAPAT